MAQSRTDGIVEDNRSLESWSSQPLALIQRESRYECRGLAFSLGGDYMSKFKLLLSSRKFWAALVGLVMLIVTHYVPDFPLPEEQVLGIVWLIVSYILGVALEDGLSRRG